MSIFLGFILFCVKVFKFFKAEETLRLALAKRGERAENYIAAQSLAIDGYCEPEIIEVLLRNYFTSDEQVTKEQVSKILSDLSANNVSRIILIILSYSQKTLAYKRMLFSYMYST